MHERVKAGIETARRKGKKFGRPRKLTEDMVRQIHALRRSGESAKKIMESFGLSERTVYRALEVIPTYSDPQLSSLEVIGATEGEPITPEMTKYHYNGKIIGVMHALWSGEDGKPAYFIGWDTGTRRHRVKSKNLPPTSKTEAQSNLDAWALTKRLQPVIQDDRK